MANLALIRGAAMAAPKFTDIRGAVEPGIQTFKNIMSLRQKEADKLELEKKRQEALKANDYRSLGALQTDGVPKEWEGFFNEQALRIKTENRDLVNQKGQIDQFDYMDQLNNQQSAIAKLQNSVETIKQYSAQYADLIENEDLSDSLTAEELKAINDIVELKGTPVYKNNEVYFITEDGKEYAMSDLPKLKTKEAPLHLEITKGLEGLIENGAKSGMFRNSEYLQGKIDGYLNNTKITGEQAKSLAADFLGLMGKDGNFADVFNALTGGQLTDIDNDGDIDEDDYVKSISSIKSDDDFIKRVKSEYKEIALMGSDNLKGEYDRINKIKQKPDYTSYQLFQIAKYNREEEIKQNEYLRRVIPAIQELANITKDSIKDAGKLQSITGMIPMAYTAKEAAEAGIPGAGFVLNKKYHISEAMDLYDIRKTLAFAMAENGLIKKEDIEDILMSIKPEETADNTNNTLQLDITQFN